MSEHTDPPYLELIKCLDDFVKQIIDCYYTVAAGEKQRFEVYTQIHYISVRSDLYIKAAKGGTPHGYIFGTSATVFGPVVNLKFPSKIKKESCNIPMRQHTYGAAFLIFPNSRLRKLLVDTPIPTVITKEDLLDGFKTLKALGERSYRGSDLEDSFGILLASEFHKADEGIDISGIDTKREKEIREYIHDIKRQKGHERL